MSNFLSLFSMGRRDPIFLNSTAEMHETLHEEKSSSSDKDLRNSGSHARLERIKVEPIVLADTDKKRRTQTEKNERIAEEERKLLDSERKSERARKKSAESSTRLTPVLEVEKASSMDESEGEESLQSEDIDDFLSHVGSAK
jgi:hypothetical protein